MRKSGFMLLIVALFLVTTSLSAGGMEPSESIIGLERYEMDILETKIYAQEEVADVFVVGEIVADFPAGSIDPCVGWFDYANVLWQTCEQLFVNSAGGVAVRLKYPLTYFVATE